MNGRTPTKKEQLYITAVIQSVGCIACILDGREVENPGAWTEFHHDPDFGSTSAGCHFRGYGCCAAHHRGVTPPGARLPAGFAVRHPVGKPTVKFAEKYGTDAYLCALTWERLPQSVKDEIGFDLSLGEMPPEAN
ncbi:Ref family protein [Serratia liquefaciens]|uniref:Ref family protein n=1 Tax=Serratia liquefaciens TaxID=614 RepID=UPI0021574A99|nr:Ref family protein [Serratia liquefaciens]